MNENGTSGESNPFTPLQQESDILQDIIKPEHRFLYFTRLKDHGTSADPMVLKRLKETYPDLKGVTVVDKDNPHNERGETTYSIYYNEVTDGGPDIVLVDAQHGNYAGGLLWQEGGEEEQLLRLMEDIKGKLLIK